ncbi:MAG: hypothetical protein ACTHKS_06580 [Gaiellaceae bacterium]
MDDDPDARSRRGWAIWSAHNYAKAYQPRSVLRAGFVGSLIVAAIVVALIWFASH